MTDLRLRPARTSDVPAIKDLVAPLARAGVLINKDTVAYYEASRSSWWWRRSGTSRPVSSAAAPST